ncbi:MAG: small conductance mechanosensitive channel [Saprospiraceae bacterium]|jgi:small conductance mechanosensitive channel
MLKIFGFTFVIIALTFLLAFLSNRAFRKLIQRSTEELKNDPTNYQFLKHASSAIIYLVGFGIAIYNVPILKTFASSLLAGAGILAVAVGFASQQALGNIVSGVFIVIFKPFRIGDQLKVRELTGIVEDITLRHTVMRDFENKRIIIPNSLISEEIIVNADFVDEKLCKWLDIGISFNSNIDKARKIMQEEVMKHPFHLDVRTDIEKEEGLPEVTVRVIGFGESSVNLRLWIWASNAPNAFVLSCDLYESIKMRFDVEGIEIPFPHRILINRIDPSTQN